ncbi:MAG: hypothetical protein DRI48_03165 [Chloroflexi bacterium]|nr:MAG: hypothetical protein DRI48_03165 [Chloroflexota bacterium]
MKRWLPKSSRWWVRLTLLLIMLFTAPVGSGMAQGTRVVVDPSNTEVAVGATAMVDIRVEDVTDLFGAEVHLEFNPALLEVVDADPDKDGVQIQPGTFLVPYFTAVNSADQANGKVHFAVSQGPDHQPVSGSGVLATITFRGKAANTSALNFLNVILSAPGGVPITTDTEGGTITVTGGETPTPTPTSPSSPVPTSTPGPTSTPAATATPTGEILGYHTVRRGETLFCIGRAYGVDPYAIARQNSILNPNLIHPGHVLAIPNAPRSLPAGRVCPRQFDGETPACRWHHTVAAGENLYRIALRYGVSMWAIAEANHIFNLHYIQAGQVLCIP